MFALVLCAVPATTDCTPAEQQTTKTVVADALTAGQIACVIANALNQDSGAVAQLCGIDNALIPIVEKTQMSTRKANASYAASLMASAKCKAADAGP